MLFKDRTILQMRVLRAPVPVVGSWSPFKYALLFGRSGERIVLYDNERGKGDHRHLGGREEPYVFISLDRLIDDFNADVARVRSGWPETER